jgi:hypothetical protein
MHAQYTQISLAIRAVRKTPYKLRHIFQSQIYVSVTQDRRRDVGITLEPGCLCRCLLAKPLPIRAKPGAVFLSLFNHGAEPFRRVSVIRILSKKEIRFSMMTKPQPIRGSDV